MQTSNDLSKRTIKTKKEIFENITEHSKKDCENLGLISCQLLQTMWNAGFLPGETKPFGSMKISTFLRFLLKGSYGDSRQKYLGTRLREEIEAQRFPARRNGYEKFIGANNRNLVPISHVREIPGTMF